MPSDFLDLNPTLETDLIKINITGTLAITRIVLPYLVERQKGLVLNIGSFAGENPTPMLQTYGGTKAFLKNWSLGLSYEYAPKGVHVELLNTYFVASKMSKISRTSFLVPSPASYVKSALNSVGWDYFSTPCLSHALVENAMKVIPSSLLATFVASKKKCM